jgi:autotransporter passenger strand-loop-strand repeat protein
MQISNGSESTVLPGQTSTGIDVLSGGKLFVTVSGTAEGTTIERGGVVQVQGGLTEDDTIFGGEENVQFGTAHVSSGGTTVGISAGGTAIGLGITQRGLARIFSGSFAENAAIFNSGALDVNTGAVAIGTTVGRGAVNIFGGFTSLTTVNATGFEIINGGTAVGTKVNLSGVQAVHSQGTASNTTIATGGIQSVDTGGVASGTTIGGDAIRQRGRRRQRLAAAERRHRDSDVGRHHHRDRVCRGRADPLIRRGRNRQHHRTRQ